MKDYYRILGVSPEAEKNEIRAAYKKLIKRYHPDSVDSSSRDDPDNLKIVQEINEAYAILANQEKRLLYDDALRVYKNNGRPAFTTNRNIEQRLYLIRCGKTKRTYQMFLARMRGSLTPWLVLGFEPVNDIPQISLSGMKRQSFWRRLIPKLSGDHPALDDRSLRSSNEPMSLDEETTQNLLDESDTLTIGDIDWNVQTCPDCRSIVKNAKGTFSTWTACSKCGHISCVGGIEKLWTGRYSTCPWCGKTNRITRTVPLGTKDKLSLKGEKDLDVPSAFSSDEIYLKEEKGRQLQNGN